MKKEFITIKFVCDKCDEIKLLTKMKRDLPVALYIASNNPSFDGHTFGDPFSDECDKVGYVLRITKDITPSREGYAQEHELVFLRNDVLNEIQKIRKKYHITQENNAKKEFQRITDCSYAFQHLENLAGDIAKSFRSLGLNKKIYEDFFYFVIGDENRTLKNNSAPEVRVIPLVRIENNIVEYRIDLKETATKDDILRQYSALMSLIKEAGTKKKRIKPKFNIYKKISEAEALYPKSQEFAISEATKKRISIDTSLADQIDHIYDGTDLYLEDPDYDKKMNTVAKRKQRFKKIGH